MKPNQPHKSKQHQDMYRAKPKGVLAPRIYTRSNKHELEILRMHEAKRHRQGVIKGVQLRHRNKKGNWKGVVNKSNFRNEFHADSLVTYGQYHKKLLKNLTQSGVIFLRPEQMPRNTLEMRAFM